MHEPDTLDLVRTARTALEADVLPHVGADARYPLLMALNALGIAARQLEDGAARRAAAQATLAPFAEGADLPAAAAALARRIREAGPDLANDARLHSALREVARLAAEESAPRARALGKDGPARANAPA